MKRQNRLGMYLFFSAIILLSLVSVTYAADGIQAGDIWKTVSGFLALFGTGLGGYIFKNLAVIKELREAIDSLTQAFAAVSLFVVGAKGKLKEDPDFVNMVSSLDDATEELADVLDKFKITRNYASILRGVITASMYGGSQQYRKTLKNGFKNEQPGVNKKILKSFDKALAELEK